MTYGNQVAAIAAAGWVHNKQGKGGIEICSVNIGEANKGGSIESKQWCVFTFLQIVLWEHGCQNDVGVYCALCNIEQRGLTEHDITGGLCLSLPQSCLFTSKGGHTACTVV